MSSFGDSSLDDDPAGENPIVRAAAVEALGRWNGSVVVVDPNDGRILSIVNQKLALTGAFTPCSTFKPVVALAGLKEGIITPQTRYLGEFRFRYFYGTRYINLKQALAHSSNYYFARLGTKLGFDRVAYYAHEFGFGSKAGLNIPDESPGVFPNEEPTDVKVGLMTSYGADIKVTLLQLAAEVSAIANGGTLYYLQYPRTPEEASEFQPAVRRHLDGLDAYFPDVDAGMEAAVENGTARLAYDPDEQIYGKTGTCSQDGARLGWFVSYSSEEHPKYVVAVLLRGGRPMYGPHAAEIAGQIYRDLRERQSALRTGEPSLPLISTRH